MLKQAAITLALAVVTLAVAMTATHTDASAQPIYTGQTGKVIAGGGTKAVATACIKRGPSASSPCLLEELSKPMKVVPLKNDLSKKKAQQLEIEAEARAYKKIKEERQRSAPTTEICYMKNGKLDCKPA